MALTLPDGWTTAPGADGHTVATKFFDGHYKTVEVSDDNDLAGAVEEVEREAQLRAQGQLDERRSLAADLRAEADRVDPDVVVAPAPAEPAVVAETPAPPVVVPTVEEVRAAADAPVVEPQASSDEPESVLAPDPAEPAPAETPTVTEGA